MAGDFIREVRIETLPALASDSTITQTHGARVYTSIVNKPEWPWLRWGEPSSSPIRMRCGAGATVSFTIHVFAREREIDGRVTQTAEDYCYDITAAVKHALHERGWTTKWGRITYHVRGVRVIRDVDDNRAYHGIVTIDARALADK